MSQNISREWRKPVHPESNKISSKTRLPLIFFVSYLCKSAWISFRSKTQMKHQSVNSWRELKEEHSQVRLRLWLFNESSYSGKIQITEERETAVARFIRLLHGDKRCSTAKQLREQRTSSNFELGPFDFKMENNNNKKTPEMNGSNDLFTERIRIG